MTCSKAASINQASGLFRPPVLHRRNRRHGLLCGSCRQVGLGRTRQCLRAVVDSHRAGIGRRRRHLDKVKGRAAQVAGRGESRRRHAAGELGGRCSGERVADRHGTAATQVRHGRGAAGGGPHHRRGAHLAHEHLPCKTDRIGALLSAVGNDLAALCLGDPSAGYGPMEVVTSTNGGASWTERCNNGSLGSVRIVGDCPGFGYPGMIEAMPNGRSL